MKRSQRSVVLVFIAGVLIAVGGAGTASAQTEAATGLDRLEAWAFLGEVIQKFSASSRRKYTDGSDEESSDLERFAGLEIRYRLTDWCSSESLPSDTPDRRKLCRSDPAKQDQSLWITIEALHGARTMETPEDPESSGGDGGEFRPADSGGDTLEIIRDANTLEWYLGMRADLARPNPTAAIYAKAEGGLIRAEDARDDVIDNHFVGLGIEHQVGVFDGSFLEVGWGRTDLFAADKRSRRGKVRAALEYTPAKKDQTEGTVGFFAEGLLDSDFGPGSDDIQIYLGLFFDVDNLFDRFGVDPGAAE